MKKLGASNNTLGIELFESENSTPCGTDDGTNSKSKPSQSDAERSTPTPNHQIYNMEDLFNSDASEDDVNYDPRAPRRE